MPAVRLRSVTWLWFAIAILSGPAYAGTGGLMLDCVGDGSAFELGRIAQDVEAVARNLRDQDFQDGLGPLRDEALPTWEDRMAKASVLTQAQLDQVFKRLRDDPELPTGQPELGCQARAHRMAQILEKLGIRCAKAFTEGELWVATSKSPKCQVSWSFHVAPLVLVENQGALTEYVIDPTLFDRPVTRKEWVDAQMTKTKWQRSYVRSRYVYWQGPLSTPAPAKWEPAYESDMNTWLAAGRHAQREREAQRAAGTFPKCLPNGEIAR